MFIVPGDRCHWEVHEVPEPAATLSTRTLCRGPSGRGRDTLHLYICLMDLGSPWLSR